MPMSSIPPESMSDPIDFVTLALAQKNAQKTLGFRKGLVTKCQKEFEAAVISVSIVYTILYNNIIMYSIVSIYHDYIILRRNVSYYYLILHHILYTII